MVDLILKNFLDCSRGQECRRQIGLKVAKVDSKSPKWTQSRQTGLKVREKKFENLQGRRAISETHKAVGREHRNEGRRVAYLSF
jgi:hypothetical protein